MIVWAEVRAQVSKATHHIQVQGGLVAENDQTEAEQHISQ